MWWQSGMRPLVRVVSRDWWLAVSRASYKDTSFFLFELLFSGVLCLLPLIYHHCFFLLVHIQPAPAQTLMILSKLPRGRRTNSATCYIFVKRHSFPPKQSRNLLSLCPISPYLCLNAMISLFLFTSFNYSLVLSRHGREKTLSKKSFSHRCRWERRERERWIKSTECTNVFIRMFKRGKKTNSIKRATLELNSSWF